MKTKIFKTALLFSILGITALTNCATAQQYDTLYNETIISLTKMGLPANTIINKIETSIVSFDVSVNALINLQENDVHGDVINSMILRNDLAIKTSNSKNPNDMHNAGIYLYDSNNKEHPVRIVDPTVVSSNKTGGFASGVAQDLTMGISKSKIKSIVSGENSRLQINSTKPIFYFYFDNQTVVNSDNWFFATASSPNEFACVGLKPKKDRREFIVGSTNAYGASSGIPTKMKIDFQYEKMSDGIYKVTFETPLEPGEYCFMYASDTPTRFTNNKIFDFGVK